MEDICEVEALVVGNDNVVVESNSLLCVGVVVVSEQICDGSIFLYCTI